MKTVLRRFTRWLVFTVAALITLTVLFYAEEDWRGARALAAAKRELQDRGEPLDLSDFFPPPMPDDQNLAMAPLFVRLFQYAVDPRTNVLTFDRSGKWYASDLYKQTQELPWGKPNPAVPHPTNLGNWMTGHATDLRILQEYYRRRPEFPHSAQPQAPADDVLLALTHFAPLLDEFGQAAAARPQTRFPVNWTQRPVWGISLPHFSLLQDLTRTLRLRASAELAANQTATAQRDLALILRLRQAEEHDPILIAAFVDATSLGLLVQTVWEGLAARQWSAKDLDAIRASLRGINVLPQYQRGMRFEQVIQIQLAEDLQNVSHAREASEIPPTHLFGLDNDRFAYPLERWLWPCLPYWPRGWYDRSAADVIRYLQEYWIDAVDSANRRVAFAKSQDIGPMLKNLPPTPSNMLVKMILPSFTGSALKFAQTQTMVDQAATACALEKCYLDRHAYPAALAELVPGYLDRVPNDVIDGAPMRYRLTVDGRYQLYSIGADGRDDGGTIAWPPDRLWRRANHRPNEAVPSPTKDKGDWVWQYAPAEPPDPPANTSRLESLP